MKEKDLKKNLDNLIIDGLIKEAEQDNADFEAAMRKMSEEEFNELIYEPAYADADSFSMNQSVHEERNHSYVSFNRACEIATDDIGPSSRSIAVKKSRWDVLRPWITSGVAAVAVILIVLVPSINTMNGKLCDSALYASQSYITPSKGGFDLSTASIDQIKEKLPTLIRRYDDCLDEIERSRLHYSADLQEAGWDLTLVYLKLHKKGDAIEVLKVLSSQFNGTPFGDHCQEMLDQL